MINISKKAEEYTDSTVSLLCELIGHKSVAAAPEKDMPYGRGCAEMLAFAADILKKENARYV